MGLLEYKTPAANTETVLYTCPDFNRATMFASMTNGGTTIVTPPLYDNVSNIEYEGENTDISVQDTRPYATHFSPDGLRCYVMGTDTNTVYQYSLSTPWDITTMAYASKSYFISQEGVASAVFFKDDGTKMFVLGTTNDTVYEYTLSVAWDVSTASYSTFSKYIGTEEGAPRGLFFKPDGTKMYVIGTGSDSIYSYTLNTAWSISSAVYDSLNFSVNSQEAAPTSIAIDSTGTKLLMIGQLENTIFRYELSTPWNISTASYSGDSILIDEEPACTSLSVKPDGLRCFVGGIGTDSIYQYNINNQEVAPTGAEIEGWIMDKGETLPVIQEQKVFKVILEANETITSVAYTLSEGQSLVVKSNTSTVTFHANGQEVAI